MGVILDTSAIIGLLELDADAAAILAAIRAVGGSERPALHLVTLGELAAGVRRAVEVYGDDSTQAASRRRALDVAAGVGVGHQREQFATFGIDAATWRSFGDIRGPLGRRVSHNDVWITASAIVNDRVLVTQHDTLAERASALPDLQIAHVRRQPR